MNNFAYTARNSQGGLETGTIVADTPDQVAEQLFNKGNTPVTIELKTEAKGASSVAELELFKPSVSLDELVMLCRQLRTLMKAGIPIVRGLSTLAETIENTTLKSALIDVNQQIQSGRELNQSLAKHPDIFMPIFISLVKIGESTGRLAEAFEQLATYLELEKQTRAKIKSAIRYPSIVMGAIIAAIVIINIWVLPIFADIFSRYDAELPFLTQVLLGSSSFFTNYWIQIVTIILISVASLRIWLKTEKGTYLWDQRKLRIPLIGHILHKATLGRFARSLSLTIQSGVPLVQGLTIIAGVVDNAYVAEKVLEMRTGIEKGDSVSRTAHATKLFTPLVLQIISIGEETGELDQLLGETAEHYENEVEYDLEKLSDAIEPIVIVILGVMVTVLALGVFLPMWDLSSATG